MTVYRTLSALIPQRHKNTIKRGIAFSRRAVPHSHLAPSFMVIGAQKAGTTSLFKYLIEHRNYLRPLLKDVYFFDRDYQRGLAWYQSFFPTLREVERRAAEVDGSIVTGEGATHYLLHPWAPKRMQETYPAMKIVVLLRDPVRRAISHYHHNVRDGVETATTALEAFEREADRVGPDLERMARDETFYSDDAMTYSYLARGRYAEQLQRWMNYFPREQFLIMSSERFYKDSDASFREICRFIGIPEKSLPAYPPEGQGKKQSKNDGGRDFAQAHFEPHNAQLVAMLGDEFRW